MISDTIDPLNGSGLEMCQIYTLGGISEGQKWDPVVSHVPGYPIYGNTPPGGKLLPKSVLI